MVGTMRKIDLETLSRHRDSGFAQLQMTTIAVLCGHLQPREELSEKLREVPVTAYKK